MPQPFASLVAPLRRGLALAVTALALAPQLLSATWSVIAVDRATGRVVIASATCVPQGRFAGFPAEGLMDIQAIVVPGVGVAAAQAGVDNTRENQRLIHRELKAGTPPADIIEMLSSDPRMERRQFGIVDLRGRCAGFSGSENGAASLAVADSVPGTGIVFSIQGNILASDDVVHDAVAAFKAGGSAGADELTDRVMAAMEAADRAGGDRRCTCSTEPVPDAPCEFRTSFVAYLLVADPDDPEGESYNDGDWSLYLNVTDENLRPGESANPVTTLRARYDAWKAGEPEPVTLDYQRFVLDNGLGVILHQDDSDPLAAVAMTFHVGSAKEVEGRTGFAHLFEHLFFLDSENLGAGGLDRLMTRIGSSTNGSTSRDRTNYFEVVPIDGLEKALWAEADKLGFFINTVTESVVAKEKQVVKNEKRQSVDNQPYGHNSFVVDEALYPEGHPYRWQVIGSLEDLQAATLEDAREFHRRWYGPNNATLVIAGDIDPAQTRAWVEKYFGEIPAREMPPLPQPPAVELDGTVRLYHEDNFARLPQLTLAWPTVPRFHPDAYALDVLADLLTDGKSTPLYQVVVEEQEVAPDVSAFNGAQELAGRFTLTVRGYAGVELDRALAAVEEGLARFESRGVDSLELARVNAGTETRFYGGLSSAIGKAFQLADYAIFAGDPGFFAQDLERTLAVTGDDVMRVFREYVAGRPYVASSFVPRGAAELALEGSERARVVEEPIVQGAEEAFQVVRGEERTPGGSFDRSVEPPFGEAPTLRAPEVWRGELSNGVPVLGIEDREIPLVQFEIAFRGGLLLEDPAKVGVAQLLAASMTEGTARRTPEELEQAIDLLGASIAVRAGREDFTISGSTLARNFGETMAVVEEILLEPRFDEDEFQLARQRTLNQLRQRSASPNAVAQDVFAVLVYGDHVLARNPLGDPASVETIQIQDLRDFHARTLVPSVAAVHVVGAVERADVTAALASLAERWSGGEAPTFPDEPARDRGRAGVYFVDIPNASQSVLNIGYLGPAETDPAYYPATVMNFRFGGGGFASDLTQELREGKGYTYGIRSGFQGGVMPGPFAISSGVRSNITLEALQLVKEIMEGFGPGYDDTDLEATRSYLLRANARAFETLGAKLGVLRAMTAYGFPSDYVLQRESVVREMTIQEVQRLAAEYLDPASMAWLVVGDARTQLPRLDALGLGAVTVLDREGNPVGR